MKAEYKMVLLFVWYGLLHSSDVFAQRYLKNIIPYQNHISFTTSNNTHIRAEITAKDAKEDYLSNQTWYFWYHKDTIIQAQGAHNGKLLHGEYKEFFSNWKPKVEGSFHYGKKVGEWKFWDDNGYLRKIGRWRGGHETGRFRLYNDKGTLVQKGKMKKGKVDEKDHRLSKLFDKITALFQKSLFKSASQLEERQIHGD